MQLRKFKLIFKKKAFKRRTSFNSFLRNIKWILMSA